MGEELLSLKWNNHQSHFVDILTFLREQEIFIDATLACGGKLYPAHKFVLSTCSDYFKQMFTKNPTKHPIVFMKDVTCHDLEALLDFMYNGEVNVPQSSLGSLIKTAEGLQIKGLAVPDDPPQSRKEKDIITRDNKKDIITRDNKKEKFLVDQSYSPPPKRLKVRESLKSSSASHYSPSAPQVAARSPHSSSASGGSAANNNTFPDQSVDDDSRTSVQSGRSEPPLNIKPNINKSQNDTEESYPNNVSHNALNEPSPGPSGLHRLSKEEELEIKQEEVVDLGDDDEGDWGHESDSRVEEGGGDEETSMGSDNAQGFTDSFLQLNDGSVPVSTDSAMTLLSQGVTPRRVARLLLGTDTVCPLCQKCFTYPESMIRHCQGHLPAAHKLHCNSCGKSFHRRDQFRYHQARCDVLLPVLLPQLPPMPHVPSP